MKRFLSTTAVLLALTGTAAYAQTQTADFGAVKVEQNDFFASDLIGMRIYNSETQMDPETRVADDAEREWDDIGEINDLVVSKDGTIRAVVLGVGGFIGIGEKDVAVSMDDITVLREEGETGDYFLVVNTSKEVLENAPEFDRDLQDRSATAMSTDKEITSDTAAAVETEAEQTAEMAETETVDDENVSAALGSDDAENKEAVQEAALTRPAMQLDGYRDAEMTDIQQLKSDDVEGSYVYGVHDETVGEIDALIMDTDGQVTEAVINVGGFLGLGEKPVKVAFDRIQVLKGEDGDDFRFYIDSSEEKLEALPEYTDN